MNTRELVCIGCPMGCRLKVEYEDGRVLSVSGNTCKNGEVYGTNEVLHPVRTLTTTVRISNRELMLPVKSASPIPKELIFDCMRVLEGVNVEAPIKSGEVIAENICNSGINIVAERTVL